MDFITLSTEPRSATGKGAARSLRRAGRIPAVLYGPQTETVMLSLDTTDFDNSVKRRTPSLAVFKLNVGGAPERLAMLKEVQRDPVSGRLIHVDFYGIDLERPIHARVPVTTRGKCQGVELGGMLQIIRRELEVLCLPGRIPQKIEIDITELGVGEAVHVEDLPLEEGVEIPHDVNFTVVTVLATRKTGAAEEGEEAAEEEGEGQEEAAEA